MTTISMKLTDLQGLALAMSTEETRYFLNGINLLREPGSDTVTATATDGHRLHSIRWIISPNGEGFNTIIPGHLVRAFLKVHKPPKKQDTLAINIYKIEGVNHIEMNAYVSIDKIALKSREVDGSFPVVERILPKEICETIGTKDGKVLNPSHVSDAVQFMAGSKPKMMFPIAWQTETSAVVVGHKARDLADARDYVAGHTGRITLVMPMRG